MRMPLILFFTAAVFVFGSVSAAEESPVSSADIAADHRPAAVAAGRARGAATAARDIKAGTLRILYSGKPWSVGQPLVDVDTGYRVLIVGGCTVTERFSAEVEAYNGVMRAFHAGKGAAGKGK
jgi:hypothetical protein